MIAYDDGRTVLHLSDCLSAMRGMPDASVDSIVTDPPYGLSNTDPAHVVEALTHWANGERDFIPTGKGFMGKAWDAFVPPPAVWDECMRILKPGGHLLAFAGSRTFDLMTLSIRFAGFDIRDSIAWLYGSGFPKSMDVSKAIDGYVMTGKSNSAGIRHANENRPGDGRIGASLPVNGIMQTTKAEARVSRDAPATDAAREWEGWGTALKPAFEPVVVARKPLIGTVAANVLAHGTGALNIDASRIGDGSDSQGARPTTEASATARYDKSGSVNLAATPGPRGGSPSGRWPANVILDESQAEALDAMAPKTGASSIAPASRKYEDTSAIYGQYGGSTPFGHDEQGGASRFFYVAKAPKSERPVVDGVAHPTVKPLALMRWLVKLVTPPNGHVLEPFAGSGTTVEAAILEGFRVTGVEMTPEYVPLIAARIARAEGV